MLSLVHQYDPGMLGGFKASSQHHDTDWGCDGFTEVASFGSCWAAADAFTGTAPDRAQRGAAKVLGSDQPWFVD
jgi:hypothetical protein